MAESAAQQSRSVLYTEAINSFQLYFMQTSPERQRRVSGKSRRWRSGLVVHLVSASYADTKPSPASATRYEVELRYHNGDVIHGKFQTKEDAIHFLRRPMA